MFLIRSSYIDVAFPSIVFLAILSICSARRELSNLAEISCVLVIWAC